MLSSLYLATAALPEAMIEILDETIAPVDFDTDANLIGISFRTFNALQACEIADPFRMEKGKKVSGGYHPTFMPEEAAQHADVGCLGEAETNCPVMLRDFCDGSLKRFRRGTRGRSIRYPWRWARLWKR